MEVVNNPTPQPTQSDGSGMGFFLGIILFIAFIIFLLWYGIPFVRNTASPEPAQPQSNNSTNVEIPDRIDVNINRDE